METFRDWLLGEMQARGYSQNKLAKRAGIAQSTISQVMNGIRGPGEDTCKAIARAFGLPPEEVFRAAGILDPQPPEDDIIGQILFELGGIPLEGKKLAVKLIQELRAFYDGGQKG